MPSVFVRQYTTSEIARYGHFGVLNRPFSVVQFIERGGFARIAEAYVYIAETDHVLMRPLPNLATANTAAAFAFGYMYSTPNHQALIDRFAPGTSYRSVQPVGPSPLLIHKDTLAGALAQKWLNLSLALKVDQEADKRFGWCVWPSCSGRVPVGTGELAAVLCTLAVHTPARMPPAARVHRRSRVGTPPPSQ